jgi:hypothetical protein
MSTNYLAAATIYKKVCVEASDDAILKSKNLDAEMLELMSFSGFADEGAKKKTNTTKPKIARCKCCRWSSPKFYQVIMNDIPLLFCLPFAYVYGLLDEVNALIGMVLTISDLICMIFYLNYDEEISIDANTVH